MLDHVSLTVADLATAERFYDAIFDALSVLKVGSNHADLWIGYGERVDAHHPERSYFFVRQGPKPEDAPCRHWCVKAETRAAVDAFWRAGSENGGVDNGKPGIRAYHTSYYAAFLIDPERNRVEAVGHTDD